MLFEQTVLYSLFKSKLRVLYVKNTFGCLFKSDTYLASSDEIIVPRLFPLTFLLNSSNCCFRTSGLSDSNITFISEFECLLISSKTSDWLSGFKTAFKISVSIDGLCIMDKNKPIKNTISNIQTFFINLP